jgi:signal transduction histidine kinase
VSGAEPTAGAHAVLDRLPEAVVLCDAAGVATFVNERCDRVLGLDREAIGQPLRETLRLRDDSGQRCALPPRRPRVGSRMAERVLQVERSDGSTRAISVTGRFDPATGGWVLTARPAGRREALARVQGDVIAIVSHEIRSPLASVKGFVRTLLLRWDRFSDEQRQTMLATVEADADRVTRLLIDLLEVSRIDAGRVRLRREPVDVGALVGAVLDKAGHRDEGTGRDLRLEVSEPLPSLLADVDRLEQIVTNLVDNALRYAPEGPIEVRIGEQDDGVLLSVCDRGPGIEPALAQVIFAKFARGRHDHRSGTGLGLYITRGLVLAHRGRIWLDQPDEGGTAFHVWLPRS